MGAPLRSNRKVFIVHGRNLRARDAMVQFLHALHLDPLIWEQAVTLTGKTAPTTLEVVKAGLQAACAIVLLLTPDEQTQLREQFVKPGDSNQPEFQPRPNVIFEAGMALVLAPERTILVRLGKTREISDIAGINYIPLSNAPESRRALAMRLQRAGCNADLTGNYLNPQVAGDFAVSIPSESCRLAEIQILDRHTIFQCGIDYLKEESHGEVLIYAPTGVWKPDRAKKDWFKTIAGCLVKGLEKAGEEVKPLLDADMSVTTTLDNFKGVYGIPPAPDKEKGTSEQWDRFAKDLDAMEDVLLPFNGLGTAHIYRLEVDTETIPGMGAIIIDDSVFIGFAIAGRHKVDSGIFIHDQKDITNKVRRWFNNHVRDIVADEPIQEMKGKKSVKQGMDDIREHYGLPRKHGI